MNMIHPQAGNWKKFDSFYWNYSELGITDPDNWCIWHTKNRDSGLMDQSNSNYIDKQMEPYSRGACPSAIETSFGHWAVGHVDAWCVKVHTKKGEKTKAYTTLCKIIDRLNVYPLLDEDAYSTMLLNASTENMQQAIKDGLRKLDFQVYPVELTEKVHDWFEENRPEWTDRNSDDQGAWPADEDVMEALLNCIGEWRAESYEDYETPVLFDCYCPDCGEPNERKGHQTCQYPQD